MERAWSLKDVSRLLNVRASRIHYAIITGAVAEPRLRIGNRRIFEAADIERLAAHFGVALPTNGPLTEDGRRSGA